MNNINDIWNNTSDKDKLDYLISFIVVALAAAFILCFTFCNENEDLTDITPDIVSEISNPIPSDEKLSNITTIVVSKKTYQSGKDFTVAETTRPANVATTPIITDIKTDINQVTDTLLNSSVMDSLSIVNQIVDSSDVNNIHDQIDNEKVLDQNITDVSEKIEEKTDSKVESTESKDDMNIQNKDIAVGTKIVSEDCIVLVGSYSKSVNANKMYKRLNAASFNAFTTQNNGFTRVGVYSSCEDQVLQSNLSQIRKEFASDAIHLIEK